MRHLPVSSKQLAAESERATMAANAKFTSSCMRLEGEESEWLGELDTAIRSVTERAAKANITASEEKCSRALESVIGTFKVCFK